MDAPQHVLPDLIKPGLRIVFCGTAAGNVSAARGAYYAHPQNRFWSALHAYGLTPRKLEPEDYPDLPRWGVGLTDIAKHASGQTAIWEMDGTTRIGGGPVSPVPGPAWRAVGLG